MELTVTLTDIPGMRPAPVLSLSQVMDNTMTQEEAQLISEMLPGQGLMMRGGTVLVERIK